MDTRESDSDDAASANEDLNTKASALKATESEFDEQAWIDFLFSETCCIQAGPQLAFLSRESICQVNRRTAATISAIAEAHGIDGTGVKYQVIQRIANHMFLETDLHDSLFWFGVQWKPTRCEEFDCVSERFFDKEGGLSCFENKTTKQMPTEAWKKVWAHFERPNPKRLAQGPLVGEQAEAPCKKGARISSAELETDFDVEAYVAELRGENGTGQNDDAQVEQGLFFTSRFELVAEQRALIAANREAALARRDAIEKQRALIEGNRERAVERKTEREQVENEKCVKGKS